jgi:hypothetical protein
LLLLAESKSGCELTGELEEAWDLYTRVRKVQYRTNSTVKESTVQYKVLKQQIVQFGVLYRMGQIVQHIVWYRVW